MFRRPRPGPRQRGRLAFVACDINSALLTVDMNTWRVTGTTIVGVKPDVVAFDGHVRRLYVAAESGWVTVLQLHGHRLRVIYSGYLADDAHVVAVDPQLAAATSPCSALPAATRLCWCAKSTERLVDLAEIGCPDSPASLVH